MIYALIFRAAVLYMAGLPLTDMIRRRKKRVCASKSMECITEILNVVGVRNWEDLKGKYIRIQTNGLGSTIDTIGNLMEDKWFNIKEFFGTD